MTRPLARITPLLLTVLLGACASVGDAGRSITAPAAAVAEVRTAPGGTSHVWFCGGHVDTTKHPLIVVDGRIRTTQELTGLALADIDNLDVLKGPAAIARYGASAREGAILITTKPGRNVSESAPRPAVPPAS